MGYGNNEHVTIRTDYPELAAQLAENANNMNSKAVSKDRKNQAMVTFLSDDGKLEDYTTIKDIFARNGNAAFVTAIVTSFVGTNGYCTKEQLLELQNNFNWDVVSHTHTHRHMATLTEQEVYDEMRLSSEYLKNNGFKGRCLCVPYGSYGDREKIIAGKYYRGMRISGSGVLSYNISPLETYELKTVWFSNSATVDSESGYAPTDFNYYKYYIDKAVSNNGWLILSTHSWEIADWGFDSLLEQVLQYAQSQTMIVGIEEALDKIENVVDSGLFNKLDPYQSKFVIGANGEIESPQTKSILLEPDSVNNDTLITEFKPNTLTICNIKPLNATGFPNGYRGLLLTYRFSELENQYAFCYQLYKTYNDNNMYVRNAKTDGSWGAWTLLNTLEGLGHNVGINGSTPLNGFPANKVSYTTFTTVNADAALPVQFAGVLTTYFVHSDYGFCYQEYKKYGTNEKWIRPATSLTTWGAWQKYTVV